MSRLRRCTIEGVGLISRAQFGVSNGLTVFTGETGSGKTMLVEGLQLALGERASPDLVARDSDIARVTLEIEPDDALRARFSEDGFELESDEDAVFVREIQREGKSSARINGRPATAAQLRAYGESLVDFVGQHEQQRLLSPAYQTDLLDRFAGDEALERRRSIAAAHEALADLDRRLRELDESAGRALAEAEFARFAATEIAEARLSLAEEDELRERRAYLANAERIRDALSLARQAIAEAEGSVTDVLGAATAALGSVARFGETLAELAQRTSGLQSEANDLGSAISRELEHADFNPLESEQIGERLDLIERLKKKYGASVADVIAAGERFSAAASAYDARDETSSDLRRRRLECATVLEADAGRLTQLRVEAARRLEQRIAAELGALGMKHARFAVHLEAHDALGPRGCERIVFALAPNRGEEPRPLSRAASGGELSRVLLAMIVVLAGRGDGASFVFDEIDAGIGGATASAVGLRLGALARESQVLCVTHLAQIASWADAHVALRKRETRAGTRIEAVALERDEIRQEVARMLSGDATRVALDHADSLLREVRSRKGPRLKTA